MAPVVSFPALCTVTFFRAWHPLPVFPRLAPVICFPTLGARYAFPRLALVTRFPALGARFKFSRAYWSRFPALSRALVTSRFVSVFHALGTSCSYPSKAIYRCDDKFLFRSFFWCSKRKYGSVLSFLCYFFHFFHCLFYLTTRATIANIRLATPTGLENKVLLLPSSNILRFLAVQYAKANNIPKSAI